MSGPPRFPIDRMPVFWYIGYVGGGSRPPPISATPEGWLRLAAEAPLVTPGSALRPRLRYAPFKVLAYVQFARLDCISRFFDGLDATLYIKTGPLCRKLKLRTESLQSHLKWLQETGYIRDLDLSWGEARFRVRAPDTFNWSDNPVAPPKEVSE